MQAERFLRTARIVAAAVIVGLCGSSAIETFQHARAVDEMAGAARALLASLSDEQADRATFAFDSDERVAAPLHPAGSVRASRHGVRRHGLRAAGAGPSICSAPA